MRQILKDHIQNVSHKLTSQSFRPYWLIIICLLSLPGQGSSQEKLKIATCQFPVSGNILENSSFIKGFIREAAQNGCDIIQFPEQALSGYPPVDITSFKDYNWQLLRKETKEIMALAKENNIWVVLGSSHFINEKEKPLNCLYIISNQGEIVDRYDKSMLTGGDLKYFTPGNHIVILAIMYCTT
jgi:predicted amidohydrolase